MTNRIFIPSMIFGLLLLTSIFAQAMSELDLSAAFADDKSELTFGERRHGEPQGRKLAMMATILELSADQQEQIKQLFTTERASHKGARQEMHAVRKALNELMHARPFDEATFRSLAEQQAAKRIEMMVARAKIKQQVSAILTPEQQVKADELRSLMGNRHQGRGLKH